MAFLPSAETALNDLFVKVSALDGTQGSYTLRVWRSASKNDDHPDSGDPKGAVLAFQNSISIRDF